MSGFARLLLAEGEQAALAAQLLQGWAQGAVLAVAAPQERTLLEAALPQRWPAGLAADLGAAVVLGTGGSSGGRGWCLQPLQGLQASAQACGSWLRGLGFDPPATQLFNPLPLHHISGLMPLLRSEAWGAEHRWLTPALMRDPVRLLAEATPEPDRPALLSLVPTQLQRLIESAEGRRWLAGFALIWVGGAALPPALAQRCRQQGLRLAPCYGSTETGAMVTALAPQAFLAGAVGCGPALPHAQLRLAADGALEIRASSLAAGCLVAGRLVPLPLRGGWWPSGDRAAFTPEGLQWCGRLDGAISSGGETVFPEQVQAQLLERAAAAGLQLEALLVLPEADPLWGARLVALVRPQPGPALLHRLEALARELPPSQRPRRWLLCPELAPTAAGKWDRSRWRAWVAQQP